MTLDNTVTIISLVIAVIALFVSPALVSKLLDHKWEREKEKKQEAEKEKGLVTEQSLQVILKPFVDKLDEIDSKLDLTKSGLQAELRLSIREECKKCLRRGFRTQEDIEAVTRAYAIYEKLGPNEVTTELVAKFNVLPLELDRPETNIDLELDRLKTILESTKADWNDQIKKVSKRTNELEKVAEELQEIVKNKK